MRWVYLFGTCGGILFEDERVVELKTGSVVLINLNLGRGGSGVLPMQKAVQSRIAGAALTGCVQMVERDTDEDAIAFCKVIAAQGETENCQSKCIFE